jgi:pimeloyl-ACP methyl ester carboxylesterase
VTGAERRCRDDIRTRPTPGGAGIIPSLEHDGEHNGEHDDVTHSHGMHVVHHGPRQAPPLVLIHGSGSSGGSWNPVVATLAEQHHVIRVDLPGHGRSSPAPSYDVPGQAGRLAAVLDGLGVGPVTAVGHSSGGYIAERSVPERLTALEVPILVIFGAADPRWDPSSVHRYDTVPNARVEQLPGVGHFPMLEAPEQIGELLLAFATPGR